MSMKRLQVRGLDLSRMGLGCMRMSVVPDSDRKESISTIHAALDAGMNLLNTGDFYGDDGHNEKLIGEALRGGRREGTFLSVKYGTFGNLRSGGNHVDVGPKNVKKYVTASLKRLGTDYLDLYQPARIDIGIPLEETIGALSRLVEAGYVRHIGLSEVDGDTLRRAHAIHPISLVEMAYAITNSSIEEDVLPTARELGIGVAAFGILGFGKLFQSHDDSLVEMMHKIAAEKQVSVSQLAHAWVLSRGDDIMPLTGARTPAQLKDSLQSLEIRLSEEEIARLRASMKDSRIAGAGIPKLVIKNGVLLR